MPRPHANLHLASTLWRTLLGAAAAYWLGGTPFYITVVIHTAHRVLGSQREVGFVTRQVTRQLNTVGAAVVLLLLVNLAVRVRRSRGHRGGALRLVTGTWVALAALHVTLLLLHPRVDRLLDPVAQRVLDKPAFRRLHNRYMLVTTLQLLAGLLHLPLALKEPREGQRVETVGS